MEGFKDVIVESGIEYRLAENGCYYPVISLEHSDTFLMTGQVPNFCLIICRKYMSRNR